MLSFTPGDTEPSMLLKRQQLDHLHDEPEQTFGLSEAERKQIWRESIAAEDRAAKEAEKNFPLPEATSPGYTREAVNEVLDRQMDYENKARKEYKQAVARKHKITWDQLKQIEIEGVEKDWPMPQ